MAEFRRIINDRRYIATVVLLIIANILIFQFYNRDDLERLQEHDGIREYVEEYKACNEQKVKAYYDMMENMERNAREMLEVDIFAGSSSFSNRNIRKTLADYERIAEVKIDNVFGAGIDSVLDYDMVHYIVVIHAFILVILFFEERKRALWEVVHSCKKGRVSLSLNRVFILFVNCTVFTLLAYVTIIAAALCEYDSFYLLGKPVQSIAALQNFTLPLSIGSFFIYYITTQVISVLCVAFTAWSILSLIHNRTYALVVIGMIFLVGYYLNDSLDGQNPMCILKYVNLYFLTNTTQIYTSYLNFSFAGLILNSREFGEMFTAVLVGILPVVCVILNAVIKPIYSVGVIERIITRIGEMIHGMVCVANGLGFELYKFLVVYRGILVIILLGIISYKSMELKTLTRTEVYDRVKEFYREYSGEISGERLEQYERMVSEIEEATLEYEQITAQYAQGKISEDEFVEAEYENKKNSLKIKVADIIKQRVDMKEAIEDRGVRAWFVDTDGVQHLIGSASSVKRIINNIMIAFVIILCILIYRIYEYRSGMSAIIRCSKLGRAHFNVNVILSIVLISFMACGLVFGMECYDTWYSYGLGNLSAPVQNVEELIDFPMKISVGTYLIMWYVVRGGLLTAVGLLLNWAFFVISLRKKRGIE